ncbi:MAG: pyridoxamine kinase [Filifactoraceae bacterium]
MEKQKRIMAIHDISCVGRCSLTVALPILSIFGFDTSVLPTAVLSTHTGEFKDFTYRDLTKDLIPIANHWRSLNLKFNALYSGFLGSYEQIDYVCNIFKMFKEEDTILMVDPVMADNGEFYSTYTPEIAKGMVRLCKMADIIVPNLTEATFLLDKEYVGESYDKEYIESLLVELAELGAKKIVLTGVSFDSNELGAACYDSDTGDIKYVMSTKFEDFFYGSGDIFASTLLGAILHGKPLHEAVRVAVDFTHESIKETVIAKQERRYGLCFERAIPKLLKSINLV